MGIAEGRPIGDLVGDPLVATGLAGFLGVLPGRPGLLCLGLPEAVATRWDRWWELASRGGVPPLHPDRPVWRLVARAGPFGPVPVAACLRLARDAAGRAYPSAVIRPGAPPPSDPWFARADLLLRAADEGILDPRALDRRLAALASPDPLPDAIPDALPEGAALAWRDDWEVRELRFPVAADLATFPVLLLADPGLDDLDPDAEAAPWP